MAMKLNWSKTGLSDLRDVKDQLAQALERYEAQPIEPPALDQGVIESLAWSADPNARATVEKHHRGLFDARYGALRSKLGAYRDVLRKELSSLERQKADLEALQEKTPRYQHMPGQGSPWTTWDRAKLFLILAASLIFLAVDLNSVATTLRESGLASFQNPIRAYFFTMIPIGLALLLKVGRDQLKEAVDRRIFAHVVFAVGLALGTVWLWLFARTFPGIADTLQDITASLSLGMGPSEKSRGGTALIFCGLAAAACVAAAGWMAAEDLVEAHRTATLVPNQPYEVIGSQLQSLSDAMAPVQALVGQAERVLLAIEQAEGAYVGQAMKAFIDYQAAAGYARIAYERLYGHPMPERGPIHLVVTDKSKTTKDNHQ